MAEEAVSFHVEGMTLRANLHIPSPGAPCIVLRHGLEAHKDTEKWRTFARSLTGAGFATLRFSFRGCGEGPESSDGAFEDTTLTSRVRDLKAALDFLGKRAVDHDRMGAVGSSLGGSVVIAAEDPRLKVLVLLATGAWMGLGAIDPSAELISLPSGRRLNRRFAEDAKRYDLPSALARQRKPTLILHGSNDDLVPIEHAHTLYASAAEPKRLCIIPGGDHSFHQPHHLKQIVDATVEWIRQHL